MSAAAAALVFTLLAVQGPADSPIKSPLDKALADLPKADSIHDQHDHSQHERKPGLGRLQGFLESWPLFRNTYLAGWLMAIVLAVTGVLVVARNQIFIGAAVSQASMLGIALGLLLGFHPDDHDWLSLLAVAASVLAALLTAGRNEAGKENPEALTGWVFLLSASLSILIVSHSPHGLEEIHRHLSSSILGSTATDVLLFGILAVVAVVGVIVLGPRLLLFSLDPQMAAAVGMRTRRWAIGFCLWLGLTVGLAQRASGMLFTFGCLVLPALIAQSLCREVRPMFIVAPLVAVTTAMFGFVEANYDDSPPGQLIVALLCLLLLAVVLGKRIGSALRSRFGRLASRHRAA